MLETLRMLEAPSHLSQEVDGDAQSLPHTYRGKTRPVHVDLVGETKSPRGMIWVRHRDANSASRTQEVVEVSQRADDVRDAQVLQHMLHEKVVHHGHRSAGANVDAVLTMEGKSTLGRRNGEEMAKRHAVGDVQRVGCRHYPAGVKSSIFSSRRHDYANGLSFFDVFGHLVNRKRQAHL
eukprot:scaffold3051_cov236-Pinguiococcus_pyrenoidosus.AAC.3